VPPPTAPPGTPGEYVTVDPLPSVAEGIRGPIGLGFRVPLLIVSTRFGAEVPNLSAWRRSVTGDLTSAFNFFHPDRSVPSLPTPSLSDPRVVASNCPTNSPLSQASEDFALVQTYPVPFNTLPPQDSGSRPRPSGLACRPGGGVGVGAMAKPKRRKRSRRHRRRRRRR
jgi:phospholipase C